MALDTPLRAVGHSGAENPHMDKLVTASAAVSSIPPGCTLVLSDPSDEGFPSQLVAAVSALPVRGFTVVCPGAARAGRQFADWIDGGQIARLIVDTPTQDGRIGGVAAESVDPVLLRQRLQASAAGAATFLGPVGTHVRPAADGARSMFFGGDEFGPVPALTPQVALVRARQGDAKGNLVFDDAVREVALAAAKAARMTLAETGELVPVLHPRHVQLPARYVASVVGAAARVLG
ncbi:CoA-transferase [Streptomyces sp. NPDC050418]|uniref:CoA-transferase n=1 Tax=Streptomyces sp. NPDC050418 TaxID=3365612 RepID=UPI00378D271A